MRIPRIALCSLLPFAMAAAALAEDAPAKPTNIPPEGFVALFDGKSLDGWIGRPHIDPMAVLKMEPEARAKQIAKDLEDVKKHWSVDKGELVNDGNGVYLTTGKDYGDFELLLDYKTVAKADSGIYLRGTPQVQIWDTTKEGGKWDRQADKGSGGLFNNQKYEKVPLVHADKPFGEWNHFRIVMIGEHVTVYLNDKLVVDDTPLENYFDRKQAVYPVGPIQLQTHGGEIRFRNVFLKEIPRKPPESGYLVQGKPAGDDWTGLPTEAVSDFEMHAVLPAGASKGGVIRFRVDSEERGYTFNYGEGRWGQITEDGHHEVLSTPSEAVIAKAVKKDGDNDVYLRAVGPHVQAWINGVPVADVLHPLGPNAGKISAAAGEGSEAPSAVYVRDLSKQPKATEFPAGPKDEEGFVSVFNGKDLTGWTGAIEGHKVTGGKIAAAAKGGGNLYIDKKYSDFVFRFEFRLFEGGNNGVGIRAEQGKDAAYYGMELQILDTPAPVYAGIKPYQAHGSVYGVSPAKRGYQVPLGEWNTEEIIANGSKITVTLNGKVITDCDLEKVARDSDGKQKTVDGQNHPGLFNKDGYIGFLGHGHRIEFRNLRIKELKSEK